MLRSGALMRLVGEAERAGLGGARETALHIIRAKKLDYPTDRPYQPRPPGRHRVPERMSVRGA
jgi:hypothetical protein